MAFALSAEKNVFPTFVSMTLILSKTETVFKSQFPKSRSLVSVDVLRGDLDLEMSSSSEDDTSFLVLRKISSSLSAFSPDTSIVCDFDRSGFGFLRKRGDRFGGTVSER